jgi:hypothetical protein
MDLRNLPVLVERRGPGVDLQVADHVDQHEPNRITPDTAMTIFRPIDDRRKVNTQFIRSPWWCACGRRRRNADASVLPAILPRTPPDREGAPGRPVVDTRK